MTDNYIQNIFDRSNTSLETNGEVYVLITTLPNSYVLSTVGKSVEHCTRLVKEKIRELESYLELDKKYYNYDLQNEYE